MLERNRDLFVFDQVAISDGLRPAASCHRGASRSVFTKPERLGIEWIYVCDLIVNFDRSLIFSELVMKASELVKDFDVARIFLEQRSQREDADLRPARRYGRLF